MKSTAYLCTFQTVYDIEELSFFFSSRRRHTRWPRDWSSDVCSSDLRRNFQTILNFIVDAFGRHYISIHHLDLKKVNCHGIESLADRTEHLKRIVHALCCLATVILISLAPGSATVYGQEREAVSWKEIGR